MQRKLYSFRSAMFCLLVVSVRHLWLGFASGLAVFEKDLKRTEMKLIVFCL